MLLIKALYTNIQNQAHQNQRNIQSGSNGCNSRKVLMKSIWQNLFWGSGTYMAPHLLCTHAWRNIGKARNIFHLFSLNIFKGHIVSFSSFCGDWACTKFLFRSYSKLFASTITLLPSCGQGMNGHQGMSIRARYEWAKWQMHSLHSIHA